jgi:large subunit ribosomal protein L37Ae
MLIDMAKKKLSDSKTFGSRYGRTIKWKYDSIMKLRKDKIVCPNCKYENTIKRISSGIWICEKCNTKFASRAYEFKQK